MTPREQTQQPGIPRAFWLWIGAYFASSLGDAVFYFAMGWLATAHGPALAGLVMGTSIAVRTVLLLIGGAIADRASPRTVLLVGDITMLSVVVTFATLASMGSNSLLLMFATMALVGVADAFYRPISGSMARRLVPADAVPRATNIAQTGNQAVAAGGGVLGGFLIHQFGPTSALWFNAASFVLVLLVALFVIRPAPLPAKEYRTVISWEISRGISYVKRHPVLRPGLFIAAATAAITAPMPTLFIPLLARAKGWEADQAGLVVAAQAVGTIVTCLIIAKAGPHKRPGAVACAAPIAMAAGVWFEAQAEILLEAVIAATLMGAGLGLIISHLGPLLILSSPMKYLSRVQSLLIFAQSLAVAVSIPLMGFVVQRLGIEALATICCAGLVILSLWAWRTPMRYARRRKDDRVKDKVSA